MIATYFTKIDRKQTIWRYLMRSAGGRRSSSTRGQPENNRQLLCHLPPRPVSLLRQMCLRTVIFYMFCPEPDMFWHMLSKLGHFRSYGIILTSSLARPLTPWGLWTGQIWAKFRSWSTVNVDKMTTPWSSNPTSFSFSACTWGWHLFWRSN